MQCLLLNWRVRSASNRTPGHNPLFEVRFALQNHPIPEVSLQNLSARLGMRSTGTARFHLACEITEDRRRTGNRLAFSREFVFPT